MRGQHDPETEGSQPTAEDIRARLLARVRATERRLELAGVSTAMLEAGDGPPVVILHGVRQFAAAWMRVIPGLVGTNRVIVPDLPGQGGSEVADGLDADRVLRWLGELIGRTCPAPPVLVGHGGGGAIAARFAVSDRDQRISRLVLIDTHGLGPFRPSPGVAVATVGFIARPTERTRDLMLGQRMVDLKGVHDRIGDDWELIAAYALEGARTPRVKAAGRRLMKEFGVPAIPEEDLTRIAVPTTLIWGRHDPVTQLGLGEAASARYAWPIRVIEDCGADPHVEQPEALLQELYAGIAADRSPTRPTTGRGDRSD